MIKFIKSFFGSKKEELPPQTYEQHKAAVVLTPVVEEAVTPVVETATEKKTRNTPAKKAPAEKKPRAARKPKSAE